MTIVFLFSRENQDPELSPVINESSKEEGEEAMLRHTTLESVAMQIMECQHILDVIRPHMVRRQITSMYSYIHESLLVALKLSLRRDFKCNGTLQVELVVTYICMSCIICSVLNF